MIVDRPLSSTFLKGRLRSRFVRRLPDRDSDGLRAGASGQKLNKPRPKRKHPDLKVDFRR